MPQDKINKINAKINRWRGAVSIGLSDASRTTRALIGGDNRRAARVAAVEAQGRGGRFGAPGACCAAGPGAWGGGSWTEGKTEVQK